MKNVLVYIASTVVVVGSLGAGFYYFFWQTLVGVLTALIGVLCWYLYKFAKIILILEEDISTAIESLEDVESSMQNIINLKLFFDDQQVQALVAHVMDSVKMSKFSVNKMVKTLTDRSKQKFVMFVDEDAVDTIIEEEDVVNMLTPSPGNAARTSTNSPTPREGTVMSIERS